MQRETLTELVIARILENRHRNSGMDTWRPVARDVDTISRHMDHECVSLPNTPIFLGVDVAGRRETRLDFVTSTKSGYVFQVQAGTSRERKENFWYLQLSQAYAHH